MRARHPRYGGRSASTWFRLVAAEVSYRLRPLLVNVPLILISVPLVDLFGGPAVASGMPLAMMLVAPWEFARRTASEDELAGAWDFRRALPLSPAMLVATRLGANVGAVALYALVALATALAFPYVRMAVRPEAWPALIASGVGVGLVAVAAFDAFYFRFGYRAMAGALPYLLLPYGAAVLALVVFRGHPAVTAALSAIARAMAWSVAHPAAGAAVLLSGAGAVAAAFWLGASLVVSRRESPGPTRN